MPHAACMGDLAFKPSPLAQTWGIGVFDFRSLRGLGPSFKVCDGEKSHDGFDFYGDVITRDGDATSLFQDFSFVDTGARDNDKKKGEDVFPVSWRF